MTDKEKIRAEVERLKEIAEYNISHSKMDRGAWMHQASVCTNLLSFIDSMQEESTSVWHDASEQPDGKRYVLCYDGKYASVAHFKEVVACKWAYVDELINLAKKEDSDLNWKDLSLQEKKDLVAKLSEDIRKEEPVSEDMWEASKQYALRQVFASTDAKMSEQAYLDLRLFSGFELAVAHKDGANWQKEQDKQWLAEEYKNIFAKGRESMKEQMMKEAVEGEISYGKSLVIPSLAYRLDRDGLDFGDIVKVLIIKGD